MKYIFRTDGNEKIGLGHVMRCLTVADALSDYNEKKDILFMCSDASSARIVSNKGFKAEILNTNYQNMEMEIPIWEKLGINQPVIIVDSYYVTKNYLRKLREFGKVIFFDDLQEVSYPVDIVINYNAFADPEQYGILYNDEKTQCYLGSMYIPIRAEFQDVEYVTGINVKNVLITTGGGDIDNIAQNIYNSLEGINRDVVFHLVSGAFSRHFKELKSLEKDRDNLIVYHDVKNMARIMMNCDLAITAGGSTIYELAAIGVPIICFSYAKNQEKLVKYIGTNVAGYVGAYDKDPEGTINKMQEMFEVISKSIEIRRNFSEKEKKLADGKGADRIAQILIKR